MDAFRITGGQSLSGRVSVAGAKNAALAIIPAALMAEGKSVIRNVPNLRDIRTMLYLLRTLGARAEWADGTVTVEPGGLHYHEAPYELVKTMRASVLVMGPLLARLGKARVSLPGGCAIGERPIDQHLKGFEAMGAVCALEHGYVDAAVADLKGASISLDMPSVGATENILMAAALAKGSTTIQNAACEPEIVDLADFLNAMGAKIKGAGTYTIEVQGVRRLKGAEHRVIPDRIEAGTLLMTVGMTGGTLELEGARADHLTSVRTKLSETGLEIIQDKDLIRVIAAGRPESRDLKTLPFPGFPTDMQAQFMALMCIAQGTSVISETIFENRFIHVSELRRLGADIKVDGRTAHVTGAERLSGANVMATDLRASAALVLAGLAAEGETIVSRIYHLDRGYYRLEEKLKALGARIERIAEGGEE